MQATRDYYIDADGKPTTDAKKGVRFIARKGNFIRPDVAEKYGFEGGEIPTKSESKPAAKTAETTETKPATKTAAKSTKSTGPSSNK